MRMRHIVICGLSGSTIYFFSHYLIKGTIFEKKKEKEAIEHKMCDVILTVHRR